MALKLSKRKSRGYMAMNKPDFIKPYEKSNIINRTGLIINSQNQSMEFINNNAYQQNILVDNNEVPRLIKRSKPAYVQNTDFLKPITFNKDPEDKYVSFRI